MKTLTRILAAAIFFGGCARGFSQSTAITYQGILAANGAPANGSYDLTFSLFTNAGGGVMTAGPLTNLATGVSNGQLTILLDYGPGVFNGASYWLEIGVRSNGDPNFSILAPRQQITPVPNAFYAQSSQNSAVADSANAVAATNLVGVLVPAQLPAAMVTNNAGGVNLHGAFSGSFGGDASALTNLNATQLGGGVVPYSVLPSGVLTNGQSTPICINGLGNGFAHGLYLTNNACLWLDTGGMNQSANVDVQDIPDTLESMYIMGMDVPYGEIIYGWGGSLCQALEVFTSCPDGTAIDSNWPQGCKTFSLNCAGQIQLWNRLDTLDNAGMIVFGQQDPTAYSNYFGIGVSQSNLLFGMTQSNGTFVTTNILIDPSGNLSLYSPNTGSMTVNANVDVYGSEFLTGTWLASYGNSATNTFGLVVTSNGLLIGSAGNKSGIDLNTNNSFVVGANGDASVPGNFTAGSLTVAAGGVGLIAQFAGSNAIVADIQADGTIDATAFNTISDRNKKEGFAPVDPRSVLERVVALPISQWNFKTDDRTRHIGPMAQDFWALFGVGIDEKHIATVDEEGVALAAIQGLNQRIDDQARQISDQGAQIKTLQQTIAELQQAV